MQPSRECERDAHVDAVVLLADADVQDVALHRAALPLPALEHLVAHRVCPAQERSQDREAFLSLHRAERGRVPDLDVIRVQLGYRVHVPARDPREQLLEQILLRAHACALGATPSPRSASHCVQAAADRRR